MTITPTVEVAGAQATFRTLLAAMASPGTIHTIMPRPGETPEDAVCFALLDHEVAFAVVAARGGDVDARQREIALTTGSTPAPIGESAFILSYGPLGDAAWPAVRRGNLAFPDEGATVIYVLPAVGARRDGEPVIELTLTGPGIQTTQTLVLAGLPAREFAALAHANRDYPMGVDAVFVDDAGRVACVPRSSAISDLREG